jgi:lincosamide nucleotidyltransferase A/C/D/E
MEAHEVLEILEILRTTGVRGWLDGGWGVDALLGRVTRPHEDVDVVVESNMLPEILDALGVLEFTVAEDHSPTRMVLRSPAGRQVDLHLVKFSEDGTGWQPLASPDGSDCPYPPWGFTEGSLLGRAVPCISAELQIEHHSGYPPRDRDRSDMKLLSEKFGLVLPDDY